MACGFGTDGRDVRHKLQGQAVVGEAEVETGILYKIKQVKIELGIGSLYTKFGLSYCMHVIVCVVFI